MFNGVKVYLEKEVQVKLVKAIPKQVGGNRDDDMFGDEPIEQNATDLPDSSAKEAQKFEKVWLKMSQKHQFKHYLNAEDNEEIN